MAAFPDRTVPSADETELYCVTSEVIERDDMLCLIVLSVLSDGLLCVTSEGIE